MGKDERIEKAVCEAIDGIDIDAKFDEAIERIVRLKLKEIIIEAFVDIEMDLLAKLKQRMNAITN